MFLILTIDIIIKIRYDKYNIGGKKLNGVILINKEKNCTSHDVVNKIKHIFNEKVGHTGTLDPNATGLLPILIGKGTKLSYYLINHDKEYEVTLKLGERTDTADSEGNILEKQNVDMCIWQESKIVEVLNSFIGKQEQIPPMYSAIKINGKKLYEYARNHEKVEVQPRSIVIHHIELLDQHDQFITFRVQCSKGTYIRSLCVDIGKKLGYPAHMQKLIRLASGHFRLENCFSLEDIEQGHYHMLSLEEAFQHFEHYVVEDAQIVYHGKKIKSDIDHQVVVCNQEGQVLAVYGPDGTGYLKSIRGLF